MRESGVGARVGGNGGDDGHGRMSANREMAVHGRVKTRMNRKYRDLENRACQIGYAETQSLTCDLDAESLSPPTARSQMAGTVSERHFVVHVLQKHVILSRTRLTCAPLGGSNLCSLRGKRGSDLLHLELIVVVVDEFDNHVDDQSCPHVICRSHLLLLRLKTHVTIPFWSGTMLASRADTCHTKANQAPRSNGRL